MSQQVNPTLVTIRQTMKGAFKERESLVDGMLVALLAKEPLFILGPPGTAKSAICQALCQAIGGNYFSWILSKFSTPEELYGPPDMQKLKESKYVRLTSGKLPEADLAFIDEIWKANSAILNTLLSVVNERVFFNDGRQKIPLQTLFAASNELPQGEELAAIYDRFVLRFTVEAMKDDDNFRALLENGLDLSKMPTLAKDELTAIQETVRKMPVASLTFDKLKEVRNAIKERSVYVSDRKWMQSMNVARAAAYLAGHTSVEAEDLVVLENVLWQTPDQIPEIRTLIRKLCNPVAEVIHRHLDAANSVMVQVRSKKINPMEAFNKLQTSKNELEQLLAKEQRKDVEEAATQLGQLCKTLAETLFKASKPTVPATK